MLFREGTFHSLPELSSARLCLRRLTMRDAQDMYAICSDPLVSRYVMWTTHRSVAETRDFLRGVLRQYRLDRPAPWAIVLREENRVIGTIGFSWINRDHNTAEIGYSLGRAHWGKGYATEALRTVMRYGFDSLMLNRIEAQYDIRNPASGRVMEKAGMTHEGRLRHRLYYKGEYVSVELYSMLRGEFHGER